MLYFALKLIENELKDYVAIHGTESNFTRANVSLGNIGMTEADGGQNLNDMLVISLVNLEEERTLKNNIPIIKSPTTGKLEAFNPFINLNLYVLFSANFANNYELALRMLGLVIRFFQGRFVFTSKNSLSLSPGNSEQFKLIFNLYTLTFEQLNHLWGSLGGKQVPSVMYRMWLVEEKDEQPKRSGELITDIEANTRTH